MAKNYWSAPTITKIIEVSLYQRHLQYVEPILDVAIWEAECFLMKLS